MKKRLIFCTSIMLVLGIFFSARAGAAIIWREGAISVEDEMRREGGKIEIGKLRIIPAVRVSGNYDSNIYLGNDYTNDPNTGPKVDGKLSKPLVSDYIFHVQPGLMLNYDLGERGGARLGYTGNWAFYKRRTEQNWDMQTGMFNADYHAPVGLILGLDNVFSSGNDPYGDATQYGLGYVKQRWNNNLKFKGGWDFFDRFKLIGYYNFYKQRYKDERDYTQNWTNNEFGLGFQMRVLPKTWGFVRYHFGIQNFDSHPVEVKGVPTNITSSNDASNKWNRVNIGLAWDSGAKLGGELNFGYEWLKYDNNTDPLGRKYEDRNTWIAGTSIDYSPFATTLLTLNIARGIKVTGAANREMYDDTSIGINVQQDLPYKFSATAGFIYSKNNYNVPDPARPGRLDNNYNGNVTFTYQIQSWLDVTAGYRYMRKDSNYLDQSFTDQQGILSIGVAY